jgi:hypothetical protein
MKNNFNLKRVVINTLLLLCTFLFCCTGRRDKPVTETTKVKKSPTINNINVYIENSGSMDGYVNGNYEFKDAIGSLLVKLLYYYNQEHIKIRFINTRIDSASTTQVSLTNFSEELNISWVKGKKTRGDTTNLNNIFQNILAQTDSSTISILFSDCIYSIGNGNVVGLLNEQKNSTMSAFLQKYKKDSIPLATTILKMKSKFKGTYYPYKGDKFGYKIDMKRPYYICVIGSSELINHFNEKFPLEKQNIPGFENKYVLSSEVANNIYYSVLQSTYNKGRFKRDRKNSKKDYIHGISDISFPRGVQKLTFAVAVDFNNIQAEDDYLKNRENYKVTTDNFSIDTIINIEKNKIKPNDWNRISSSNPTHIIIMTAKTKAVSDVSFLLMKKMPQWVNDSNTEDDSSPDKLNETTFGLYYWVTGIAAAYKTIYPNNKNFFECTISID